jgi:DNA-binding PadR family transcriptional regulator
VLGLLKTLGEATPYDLKRVVGATIGMFFSIPHSQLYAEPERLAKAGYLKQRQESGGRRRKHYSLTAKGEKALEDWVGEPTGDLYELRDPGLLQLTFGSDPKALARTQLASHEARLAELRESADVLKAVGAAEGLRLVNEAGIGHAREYIRFWKKLSGA